MHPENWQKIESIFYAALPLPRSEWDDFVNDRSSDDPEVARQVLELLEEDESGAVRILEDGLFELGTRVINAGDDLLAGEMFGPYRIEEPLGRGGMGSVFRAVDTRLNRTVALKVLPRSITGDMSALRRFKLEARTASQIADQNVAHIYEFGELSDRHYLAMEFVTGQTLRKLISSGNLTPEDIINYSGQIAAGLAAAHRNGVIHRDIKPENVMISDDGVAKILDFGLAKRSDPTTGTDSEFRLSIPGMIFGTTSYMSPEQIRGEGIDVRTDIWSAGVLFYEMITGKRPFIAETSQDLKVAILRDDPPPIKPPGKKLGELPDIVNKCLQKDRDARYADAGELHADFRSAASVNGPRRVIAYASAAVLLIAAAAGIGLWYVASRGTNAVPAGPIDAIAVLPFADTTGIDANEILAQGISSYLANRVSQLPSMSVRAQASVSGYKGRDVDPVRAGRELSVDAVLTGTLAERGEDIVLDLRLTDVRSGERVWAREYTRNRSQIISLQAEVARDLTHTLKPVSTVDENQIARTFTTNNDAWVEFLRGRYYWNRRTGPDLQKSIACYEKAIKLDPTFALAYAAVADSYLLYPGFGLGTPEEYFPKAKAAASHALELDDTLAPAHTALSYALFNYDWNFAESEKSIRRAIALDPNYATAHHWYGNANLLALGRYDESIESMKRAQQLDPLSLIINSDLGTSYLYAGRLDEAIAQFNHTLEMDPNFNYANIYLGRAYLMKGDYESAIASLTKAGSLDSDPRIPMLLSWTYAKMGRQKDARAMLRQLQKMDKDRFISNFDFALTYTALGDRDNAIAALERAYAERDGNVTYMIADPLLSDLRPDPRFQALATRLELTE